MAKYYAAGICNSRDAGNIRPKDEIHFRADTVQQAEAVGRKYVKVWDTAERGETLQYIREMSAEEYDMRHSAFKNSLTQPDFADYPPFIPFNFVRDFRSPLARAEWKEREQEILDIEKATLQEPDTETLKNCLHKRFVLWTEAEKVMALHVVSVDDFIKNKPDWFLNFQNANDFYRRDAVNNPSLTERAKLSVICDDSMNEINYKKAVEEKLFERSAQIMTVRELVEKHECDVEIANDYVDEGNIGFMNEVGDYVFTEEGLKEFADIINLPVSVYEENAVVHIPESSPAKMDKTAEQVGLLFAALAGYVSETEYDNWFTSQEKLKDKVTGRENASVNKNIPIREEKKMIGNFIDPEDDSIADESDATRAWREAEKESKLTDDDFLPSDIIEKEETKMSQEMSIAGRLVDLGKDVERNYGNYGGWWEGTAFTGDEDDELWYEQEQDEATKAYTNMLAKFDNISKDFNSVGVSNSEKELYRVAKNLFDMAHQSPILEGNDMPHSQIEAADSFVKSCKSYQKDPQAFENSFKREEKKMAEATKEVGKSKQQQYERKTHTIMGRDHILKDESNMISVSGWPKGEIKQYDEKTRMGKPFNRSIIVLGSKAPDENGKFPEKTYFSYIELDTKEKPDFSGYANGAKPIIISAQRMSVSERDKDTGRVIGEKTERFYARSAKEGVLGEDGLIHKTDVIISSKENSMRNEKERAGREYISCKFSDKSLGNVFNKEYKSVVDGKEVSKYYSQFTVMSYEMKDNKPVLDEQGKRKVEFMKLEAKTDTPWTQEQLDELKNSKRLSINYCEHLNDVKDEKTGHYKTVHTNELVQVSSYLERDKNVERDPRPNATYEGVVEDVTDETFNTHKEGSSLVVTHEWANLTPNQFTKIEEGAVVSLRYDEAGKVSSVEKVDRAQEKGQERE